MGKFIDLTGKRFGKLTVLERTCNNKRKLPTWLCKCDCGNEIIVDGESLRRSHTRSCGCIHLEDLTGLRFGKLTVIQRAQNTLKGKSRWLCKCDCGNTLTVTRTLLTQNKNNTRSCGCLKKEITSRIFLKDLTGKTFGRLTVIRRNGENNKHNRATWLCQCECGNTVIVAGNNLQQGHVKSCGCLPKYGLHKKHELSKSRLFKILTGMGQRCYNPKNPNYGDYGGRGINICDEWLNKENGFIAFYNWAMANGYQENLSIDRINNDKGYSPDNCRWANSKWQCNNKRNTIKMEYNGETKTFIEWCQYFNISVTTARARYHRGKSFEEIFNIKN